MGKLVVLETRDGLGRQGILQRREPGFDYDFAVATGNGVCLPVSSSDILSVNASDDQESIT